MLNQLVNKMLCLCCRAVTTQLKIKTFFPVLSLNKTCTMTNYHHCGFVSVSLDLDSDRTTPFYPTFTVSALTNCSCSPLVQQLPSISLQPSLTWLVSSMNACPLLVNHLPRTFTYAWLSALPLCCSFAAFFSFCLVWLFLTTFLLPLWICLLIL